MRLFLLRHGEAESAGRDPKRPLSAAGRAEVERVARWAARNEVAPQEIWHSGKLRAAQTAEILAKAIAASGNEQKPLEMPGLAPNDDPGIIRSEIDVREESILIAGHLPHLSRLATLLLTGSEGPETVSFYCATLLSLVRTEEPRSWSAEFLISPSDLAHLE